MAKSIQLKDKSGNLCYPIYEVHNTSERKIGKTNDGKDLYAKTYRSFTYNSAMNYDEYLLETDNNKQLISSEGHVIIDGIRCCIPSPDAGLGALGNVYQNSGVIFFTRTKNAYGSLSEVNITIKYTKK